MILCTIFTVKPLITNTSKEFIKKIFRCILSMFHCISVSFPPMLYIYIHDVMHVLWRSVYIVFKSRSSGFQTKYILLTRVHVFAPLLVTTLGDPNVIFLSEIIIPLVDASEIGFYRVPALFIQKLASFIL